MALLSAKLRSRAAIVFSLIEIVRVRLAPTVGRSGAVRSCLAELFCSSLLHKIGNHSQVRMWSSVCSTQVGCATCIREITLISLTHLQSEISSRSWSEKVFNAQARVICLGCCSTHAVLWAGCIWLAVELGVKNATTGILLVVVVLVRRRPSPPTAHLDQLRQ